MKGHKIHYSDEELYWIEANATLPRKALCEAFISKFKRDDVNVDHIKALCTRKGWTTGRTGFELGHVPVNKGKPRPFNANSAKTQFKKGNIAPNAKYLGHERITPDGYVEISASKINKHTGATRSYVLKHRYLWEMLHGKVPEGMCLKCLDGNRQNTDPSNWEALPRGALPFLNGHRGYNYDAMPEELRPAVLTLAKLRYQKKAAQSPNRGSQ